MAFGGRLITLPTILCFAFSLLILPGTAINLDQPSIPRLADVCGSNYTTLSTADGEGCFLPRQVFAAPSDFRAWRFMYAPKSGANVRFHLRAEKGSVKMTVQSLLHPEFLLEASTGPWGEAVVALSVDGWGDPTYSQLEENETWAVTVRNEQVRSDWQLQVDMTEDSVLLNDAHRDILLDLYKACCPVGLHLETLHPCAQLSQWSLPLPDKGSDRLQLEDACRHPLNLCDKGGNLLTLVLDYSKVNLSSPSDPAPFAKCTKPPAVLSNFTHLTHLELVGLGMAWNVNDTFEALQPVKTLKHLHLPYNQLQGELGGVPVCNYFGADAALESLSLGNPSRLGQNPSNSLKLMLNRIQGIVDPCVLNSKLTSLNLDYTWVRKVPDMPVGTRIARLSMRGTQVSSWGDRLAAVASAWELETLPETLSQAAVLAHLDLTGRGISGMLPLLPGSLVTVDLAMNNISGEIPPTLLSSELVVVLDLSRNERLEGDIVAHIAQAKSLMRLDLSLTQVSGDLGASNWSLPHLEYLNLAQTQVSGDLGTSEWDLPVLERLVLSSTGVGGQLHGAAWKLPKLKHLLMQQTRIEGLIPAFLAGQPDLETINLSGNRGIVSQAAFASSLRPGNNINMYDVSNCSINHLPEGLQWLGVFNRNCSGLSTPLSVNERRVEWYKYFDVSGNLIQDLPLPAWLLGPFPSTCFSSADEEMVEARQVMQKQLPQAGKVELKLQARSAAMWAVPGEEQQENSLLCGGVVPSQDQLDFVNEHMVAGPELYCLDGMKQEVRLYDAMLENFKLRDDTAPTQVPPATTTPPPQQYPPPRAAAPDAPLEVPPPSTLPPPSTVVSRDSQTTTSSQGFATTTTTTSSSSTTGSVPPAPAPAPAGLSHLELIGIIVGAVLGGLLLLGVVIIIALKGTKRGQAGAVCCGKVDVSVPLASLDSLAKPSYGLPPGTVVIPVPALEEEGLRRARVQT